MVTRFRCMQEHPENRRWVSALIPTEREGCGITFEVKPGEPTPCPRCGARYIQRVMEGSHA